MEDGQEKTILKLQIQVILLSFAVLIGAMIWTWQVGMASNLLDHQLEHASGDLKEMRQEVGRLEGKRA